MQIVPTGSTGNDDAVSRARGFAVVHRMQDAEALYREALLAAPDNAEALNYVGLCELGRGEFASARQRLERAVAVDPHEASFRKNLGIAQLALGDAQAAIDTFDEVIATDPKELSARLHRAVALERLGNIYDATTTYYRAIATAQAAYRWRNNETTPPALRSVIRHAIGYIKRNRREIFMEATRPARDVYGEGSIARVEEGLSIYLNEAAPADAGAGAGCSFFCVPRLSAQPMLDPASMPGIPALAGQCGTLLAEFDAARSAGTDLEPFFGTHDLGLLREQGVLDGDERARLDALYVYRNGDPEPVARQRLPRTFALIGALPQPVQVENLAPSVYFIVIAPGTRVRSSLGVTNARVNVEIPLRVEGRCVRTVAGEERVWHAGAAVAYEGTFEHELWNHGPGLCTALVIGAWHPGLTAAERMALPALFESINRFSLAAGVQPPYGDA